MESYSSRIFAGVKSEVGLQPKPHCEIYCKDNFPKPLTSCVLEGLARFFSLPLSLT